MRPLLSLASLVCLFSALGTAAPHKNALARQAGGERLVFAHFMMGIVANRKSAEDYDSDFQQAKKAGIDAFALNIGTDAYNVQQLDFAYKSAAKNGMKVFISFDFHYYGPSTLGEVAKLTKQFGGLPGQLKVDNKIFVSSFVGDSINVADLRAQVGSEIYFAPNFSPDVKPDAASLDGALSWVAWDSDGANKAPKAGRNVTVAQGDAKYKKWLGDKKGYIAPVSPWFFTHYGPEVSYSKNWVFPSDLLWYSRWNEILDLSPRFIEILTWNDYGESHYVGPLSGKHHDDGNSKWVNDMPHTGWLEMAKPFIAAYKAGDKSPAKFIKDDKIVYWYRPTPKTLDCSKTDTTMADIPKPNENYFKGRPDGSDTMQDAVFVVSLLKEAGKIVVNSGKQSKTFDAPAGANAFQVPMGVGKQTFQLLRDGKQIMGETSLRDITDTCPCGLYNFNAFVGVVPAGPSDPLDSDGLAGLTKGLKVSCAAKPSLPIGGGSAPVAPVPTVAPSSALPVSSRVASSVPLSSKPVESKSIAASSATPSATTPAVSSVKTSVPAQSTPATKPAVGGCTATVTASAQIFPTNCLSSGQVWAGAAGRPDCCDGASPCCK